MRKKNVRKLYVIIKNNDFFIFFFGKTEGFREEQANGSMVNSVGGVLRKRTTNPKRVMSFTLEIDGCINSKE